MNPDPNRRRVLLAAAAWLLASGARAATRLEPTPAQSAGPFYPTEPPLDDDQDLTRVRGALGLAQGRITDLSGRLLDRNGRPISARASKSGNATPPGATTTPWIAAARATRIFRGSVIRSPTPRAATAFALFGRCPIPAAPPTFTSRCFPRASRPSSLNFTSGANPGTLATFCSTGFPRNGDRGCWPTLSPCSGTGSNWQRTSI